MLEKILLMMAAPTFADAQEALQSARSMAAKPELLSFGLSLEQEPTEEEMTAMAALVTAQFLCPAYNSRQGVEALWQGEGYILMGHAGMVFSKGWDRGLLRDLKRCQTGATRRALLTGYLPRTQDPIDAVCPVAAESFDQGGLMHYHRGTPLRYARAPQPGVFIHPDFCFAPADFFRESGEEREPVFLRAFRNQWSVFTSHRALIRLRWDEPAPPCDVRGYDGGRAGKLRQFEQKAGVRFEKRQLSAMARLGLFGGELHFPVRVPLGVKVQEMIRRAVHRRSRLNPLCVTAHVTLPEPPPNLPEEYLGWFEYLTRLKNLSLLCYADAEHIRRVSPIHPNVLEFKRRYGLPTQGQTAPADALNLVKLSKPFLLGTSREKFLTHSHYVWMDFGCLRYPVYENAWLNWEIICRDRIVFAAVEGRPDLSMFTVPEKLVLPLCRDIAARCDRALKSEGRLPKEEDLWAEMVHEKPEWFEVREMPGYRELFTLLALPRGEEYGTKA